MNMKKIMAGVAASALAVSTMAVAASAASDKYVDTYTRSLAADKININDDGTFYAQVQNGASTDVTWTITYTTADGATGYALIGINWGEPTEEANGVTMSGNWNGAGVALPEDVVEAAAGDFSTITLDVTVVADTIDADAQTQADAYGEESVVGDMIVAFIGSDGVAYRNGFGTIRVEAKADEPAPSEGEGTDNTDNTPAEGTGNTNTATNDKQNADTGIEGVAVVAGLAIIAAGAVVVAKKRG